MRVEASDVQGIIISGYPRLTRSRHVLLTIHDPAAARRWLAGVLPSVTSAHWKDAAGQVVRPGSATNVAFTAAGLVALGLPPAVMATFPEEFRQGMADPERARRLGDNGASDPKRWQFGGPAPAAEIHALLILKASSDDDLNALTAARWTSSQPTAGMTAIRVEDGQPLEGQKEHFGFHDGVSQPEIEGSPKKGNPADDCLKAGEFILGYENEYAVFPATPLVPAALDPQNVLKPYAGATTGAADQRDLGRNGSYLVFRKLEQDVAAFRRFVHDNATDAPGRDLLAAKMVGRWPSGTSLIDAPTHDVPPPVGTDPNNAFRYTPTDPYGLTCPLGAHVRRNNPRDAMSDRAPAVSLRDTRRHRILRRAVSYGPPLPPGALTDDATPRGLLFQAVNADIKRQFEFIQQTWTNNPKFHGLDNDRDPVIGDNVDPTDDLTQLEPRVFTLQRDNLRVRLSNLPRFVTMKGGAYLFLPSLAALRFLATPLGQ